MLYRNIRTGIVFETPAQVSGGEIVAVEKEVKAAEKAAEPVQEEKPAKSRGKRRS